MNFFLTHLSNGRFESRILAEIDTFGNLSIHEIWNNHTTNGSEQIIR